MKKSNRYSSDSGKAVWAELEKVHRRGYSQGNVFSDFLELSLSSLLALMDNMCRDRFVDKLTRNKLDGVYNERYMEIIRKYNNDGQMGKRSADYFAQAFTVLCAETMEKQKDIIGCVYEERITFGESGQFFTSDHITQMMLKMMGGGNTGTVQDPCCGSGRFLISAAKENPEATFYGTDIDKRCAMMTALNMFLLDLNAVITWGNTITFKSWKQWVIRKGGYIVERECKEEVVVKTPSRPVQLSLGI